MLKLLSEDALLLNIHCHVSLCEGRSIFSLRISIVGGIQGRDYHINHGRIILCPKKPTDLTSICCKIYCLYINKNTAIHESIDSKMDFSCDVNLKHVHVVGQMSPGVTYTK